MLDGYSLQKIIDTTYKCRKKCCRMINNILENSIFYQKKITINIFLIVVITGWQSVVLLL